MISLVIVMVMVFCIVYAITRASDGYRGGFCAPRYVFVNNLWFPAGPDGRPKPGSVGMKRRPAPPPSHRSGGFGGGSRGGGFGGGGFGGVADTAPAPAAAPVRARVPAPAAAARAAAPRTSTVPSTSTIL